MHFFLGNIYSRGLKCLQVIYENFDCDLTHGFFIQDFNKYLFYDHINFDSDLTQGFFIRDFNKYLFMMT